METQLYSLSKIFNEKIFRIPDYQRGYAWEERQLNDFWNDVIQLQLNQNHYTGVLTLEEVPNSIYNIWENDLWIIISKNYQPYFIVDGQQRLTTLIILIQVITEKLKKTQKLNYTSKSEIQKKYIFDSKDDGISRSYIFGYEKDNPSYEFLKTKIFKEHSTSNLIKQETIYTANLEFAKSFFQEKINKLSDNEIEIIFRKITQHLLFNLFIIKNDIEVCVAFETMNNRGKPLSFLELLKNRLIYLSIKMEIAETDRIKLRQSINDCWRSIYHYLGRNKNNPLDDDFFLQNHTLVYFKDISRDYLIYNIGNKTMVKKNRLTEGCAFFLLEKRFIIQNILSSFKKRKLIITLQDIYNYVLSLQKSVELWYKIFNPFASNLSAEIQIGLDKIIRLNEPTCYILILLFFQENDDENKRLSFLQIIEKYIFLISLFRLLSLRHTIRNILNRIDDNQLTIDEIIPYIRSKIDSILSEKRKKRLYERMADINFYEWKYIRYLLYEYNLDLQNKSKTKRKKIFWPEFNEDKHDFITVEHIYPQTPKDNYWTSIYSKYSLKQKHILCNSLGNLLPLSKPKNSSLQNLPFPQKINSKNTDNTVGFRYGSYAENEITKFCDWTAKEILLRGLKILNFIEVRWGINLGDNKNKIKLLNLDFVIKKEELLLENLR